MEHPDRSFRMNTMRSALDAYVKVQHIMAGHIDLMLGAGVPDWRLDKLPRAYSELISQEEFLMADGMTRDEIDILHKLHPTFENLCNALSQFQIPSTIEHGDFHDNNILISDGRLTLSDWGDAAVSHPFFSLTTVLRRGLRDYNVTPQDKEYIDLKNAYLNQWLQYESESNLEQALALATRLGKVMFAISFMRIRNCSGVEVPPYTNYLTNALRSFIEAEVGRLAVLPSPNLSRPHA